MCTSTYKCTNIERNIKILKSDYLQVVNSDSYLFPLYMIGSFNFFCIVCITVMMRNSFNIKLEKCNIK